MQYYFVGEDRATYRWDLGARADGQPEYQGRLENPPEGLSSSELEALDLWVLHYFEYTTVGTNDILTSKKIAIGSWDNRATYTYR